jgi:choline dehydrogenase-like flavoprotein
MIVDPSELYDVEGLEADICILGAGPAGLTLARELEDEGRRVLLIESGGLEFDEATQSLCDGPGDDAPDPYCLRRRQFGGTSNMWGAQLGEGRLGVRYAIMDEVDFEPKEKVPHTGWPFRKGHLEAYYERARELVGVAPYDVSRWEDRDEARRLNFVGDRITTSVVQFGPRDVFLKECRERVAASKSLHAYIKLNVVEIESNPEATRATRVKAATLDGKQLWIAARTFVLAAGGIENARILLLSDGSAKAGLGNRNDLVGRFFIDHYGHFGGMVFPADRDIFNHLALYDIRKVDGFPGMGVVVPTRALIRRESLLNTVTYLVPKYPTYHHSRMASSAKRLLRARILNQPVERKPDRPEGVAEHLRRIVVGGAAHFPHKLYRKLIVRRPFPDTSIVWGGWSALPHKEREFGAIEIQQHIEQAPDPENRVLLTDERDRLGCRKARVDRRLNEVDRESLRRINLILREEFARSGIGRFVIDEDFVTPEFSSMSHGASHHMGTTRMHDDPRSGVVDATCRVHGMANLYVAGSSVFPTGGWANPTLTIVALAIRLADHLKAAGPDAT